MKVDFSNKGKYSVVGEPGDYAVYFRDTDALLPEGDYSDEDVNKLIQLGANIFPDMAQLRLRYPAKKKVVEEPVKPMPWEEQPARLRARCAAYLDSPAKMDDLRKLMKTASGGQSVDEDPAVDVVKRVFALIEYTNRAEHQTWKMWEACGRNIGRLEKLEFLIKDRFIFYAPLDEHAVAEIFASIRVLGSYNNGLVFVDYSHADHDYEVGSTFELDGKEYKLTYVTEQFDSNLPAIPRGWKTLCRFEPEITGLTRLTTWDTKGLRKPYLDFVSAPLKFDFSFANDFSEQDKYIEETPFLVRVWHAVREYMKKKLNKQKQL